MVLFEVPRSLVGASRAVVRKQGRHIETRPIAGTRPRGQGRRWATAAWPPTCCRFEPTSAGLSPA